MVMGYTDLEKKIVQKTYTWRNRFMGPLLSTLTKWGMTANKITYFRALITVGMLYELFVRGSFNGAIIVYVIFLLLDGLDGALARFQNASSDKGKFNDILIDQLTYALLTFGMAFLAIGSTGLLFFHVIISGTVYLLAVLAKNINKPSDWLIHAEPNLMYLKSFATIGLILLVIFKINVVDIFVFILNIWMTVLAFYYFVIIQKTFYKKNEERNF
jgi:phosphatidylglycerophosphate synthase